MKITPTGIAIALALIVVIVFFVFPGLFPFGKTASSNETQTQAVTNNQTASAMPTIESAKELMTKDEVVGAGAVAAAGDTVTVNYIGALTNGKIFDASANHGTTGFTFNLGAGQVIRGWDQGIVGMKEGGKRILVIPASLAYGDQEVGGGVIPANSTLIFEVELLKVQK